MPKEAIQTNKQTNYNNNNKIGGWGDYLDNSIINNQSHNKRIK